MSKQKLELQNGEMLEYELTRSARRRSIGLKVDRSGLTLVIPTRATLADAERAIRAKLAWIRGHLSKLQNLPQVTPNPLQAGATVQWLGQPCQIIAPAPRSRLSDQTLALASKTGEPAAVLAAFVRFSQAAARVYFAQRAAFFAPLMRVSPKRVLLTSAGTRWGSCTAAGDVRIHWRLMQAPPAVVDYVIVHELAHLREMNHSPRFWAEVEKIVPDWKTQRQWLRQHGNALHG
ncbi:MULTISPECIES: M48 family metallopeptidase [Silvimonas]|uniref:M48 family metallopeptidase n=1 Tax=Silvimonas TaxID=300264 RepID=UPI0024B3956F|nr:MULTISPECIES: SprT family zinc-dependent metalloprotease [Silvimonas]MDR3425907.1 SprT family zinc-dependent metalloprotease [Silvimonas sp.]